MNKKALIKEYAVKHRYFTLDEVIRETDLSIQVAKNYLHELKKAGIVFSAGKGVYSSIANEFHFDENSRVKEISWILKRKFPFVDFIIWNTLYLQPFYHHTQTHHITFVEVEMEAVNDVAEAISLSYRNVFVEKRSKNFAESLDITGNPVIVRSLIDRSPRHGHNPQLEKMLVDLFIIKDKYRTMPESDYWELWRSLYSKYRINIGKVVAYARRRKCLEALVTQIIDNKEVGQVTFGAYFELVAKVILKKRTL